jgi:hypothetical protein
VQVSSVPAASQYEALPEKAVSSASAYTPLQAPGAA